VRYQTRTAMATLVRPLTHTRFVVVVVVAFTVSFSLLSYLCNLLYSSLAVPPFRALWLLRKAFMRVCFSIFDVMIRRLRVAWQNTGGLTRTIQVFSLIHYYLSRVIFMAVKRVWFG